MEDKIKKHIEELQQTVTVAGLNYEVWWTFKERESRKKYVDTMNNYTMFFQTSIHAHFVALLISLYEKGSDLPLTFSDRAKVKISILSLSSYL